MVNKDIKVINKIGFHVRPVSLLIQEAKKFDSNIIISKKEKSTDLKSLIGLMQMQVKMGDVVTVSAEGPDEVQALDAISLLIESGFGEE